MNEFDILLHPEKYNKKAFQYLFMRYCLYWFPDYDVTSFLIDPTFRPDVFLSSKDQSSVLLVQLTTEESQLQNLIQKVTRYGKMFEEEYHKNPYKPECLRLMVVGPWTLDSEFSITENEGLQVGLMPIRTLYEYLLPIVEEVLRAPSRYMQEWDRSVIAIDIDTMLPDRKGKGSALPTQ